METCARSDTIAPNLHTMYKAMVVAETTGSGLMAVDETREAAGFGVYPSGPGDLSSWAKSRRNGATCMQKCTRQSTFGSRAAMTRKGSVDVERRKTNGPVPGAFESQPAREAVSARMREDGNS